MTDTSYFPPAASPRQEDGTGTPGPVLVAVAEPARQRRVTVAIRLVLAIPHLLALYFLGMAAFVVGILGWLGALVTGRLPRFAAAYLSGYLRWYSRVGAYLLLLTDAYPPFAFGDATYPVRLAVGGGRLNRLTVAFRIILAIPAAVVSMLLTFGCTTIVIFIGWLTALIAGRLPAALHGALAAIFRYNVRYYGYVYLLTSVYPAGIFGDEPSAGLEPVSPPSGQPASWQLALSSGAKRLVGLILALGLLTAAGGGAWAGTTIYAARQRDREISQLKTAVGQFNAVVARHNAAFAQEQQAATQVENETEALDDANDALDSAIDSPGANSSNCLTLNCFSVTTIPDVDAFAAFSRTLRATRVPPGSAAIAKRLLADSTGSEQDYREITQATSFTSIENFATNAEKVGGEFDNDFAALQTSVGNVAATLDNQAGTLDTAAMTLNQEGAALNRRAAALNVKVSVRTANGAS